MIETSYVAGMPFISEDPEDLYILKFSKCHTEI